MSASLPLTVFMFSDLEGSTKLWERYPAAMKKNIVRHDHIVDSLIVQHGGKVIDHAGDGVFAVFEQGTPLHCALDIQRLLQQEPWEEVLEIRIRMGFHSGVALKQGQDYRGPLANRTARIMSTGWGGQILVTPQAAQTCPLPDGATLEDLGAHQLKDLSDPQPILGLIHSDLKIAKFPPLRSLSAHPNNLPPQPNAFVGRKKELAHIATQLADPACRLLTLLGPGGMGKTRLALQAAAEAVEQFKHGVYFVYLAPLGSPDAVVAAIADALKFTFYSREAPQAQLLSFLREKDMLLVLDNLEHVMGVTDFLIQLLQACPQVRVLVTSRERLNLMEESTLEMDGLEVPDAHTPALEEVGSIQLFLERAKRVNPAFALSDEVRPHLIRICQLVGGTPLGIELAAAWVRAMSCQDIARQIEEKLDFLSTSLRNAPERHRSLRAVFEYSWQLLSDEEKAALQKLSLLRGNWDAQAAGQIADAPLPVLASLLDKSLLRRTTAGRFFTQELLRYYAEEKLKADAVLYQQIQESHGRFFADFLANRAQDLKGASQGKALEDIQLSVENARAAWQWAASHGRQKELEKAVDGLCMFFEKRGRFQEGRTICEQTSAGLAEGAALGKLLNWQGYFEYRLGQHAQAKELLERGLALAEQLELPHQRAFALNYLGTIAVSMGDYAIAAQHLQESLALREAAQDRWGIVASLNNLGAIAMLQGDYALAKQHYQQSLGISRALGDPWGIAAVLSNLGEIHRLSGELAEAKPLFQESLTLRRQLGDRWGIATSLNNLGAIAQRLSQHDEADQLYRESLAIRREMGDRTGIATSLNNLGSLATLQGQLQQAHQLFQESLTLRRELGDRWGSASSQCELGYVAAALGNLDEARNHLAQGVRAALEIGAIPLAMDGLLGIADLLQKSGQTQRTVELLSLLLHHPTTSKKARDKAQHLLEQVKGALTPQALSEALETGKGKELADVVQYVLNS